MPGARCTRSPLCKRKHRGRSHRYTGITRHSRTRMVLTVSFALSPGTGLFCPRRQRDAKHHRQLDASVGASGPHDFAVRESLPQKPLGGFGTAPAEALAKADQRRSSCVAVASTASRSNVRDDRETPLSVGRDSGNMEVICGKREAKYFFGKDWTGSISLIRFDKFAVRRKGSTPSARRSSLRRHCERSEAIHFAAQSEIGLLPPSLFELRRTRSALRSLAQTHRVCRRQ
jgi:hypothetical protein